MYPSPYGYSPFYGGEKGYKKKDGVRIGNRVNGEKEERTVKGGETAVPRLAASDNRFKPKKIKVYKNGDELDAGFDVAVTKKMFPHWVS